MPDYAPPRRVTEVFPVGQRTIGIESDGTTVWVHEGVATIGRFGKLGIDVHTVEGDGCLHCTHERTDAEDWQTFKAKMMEHHGVYVHSRHKPTRFA